MRMSTLLFYFIENFACEILCSTAGVITKNTEMI